MAKQYEETMRVRTGEEFDQESVKQYLQVYLKNFPKDQPMHVKQFPTGASNLTYLLSCGEWAGVLRRPPFGPLPPKAHDMKRESTLLSSLNPSFPLAPKPYIYCEDESIIGAPFYVMEEKKGIVIDKEMPSGYDSSIETRWELSALTADTLVDLHRVDYQAADLASFGRPEGFLDRQVNGWIKRYERAKTDDIPAFEKLAPWLLIHIPTSSETTVIHNDFKLNNLLFSKDLSEVVAVLDWEMSTVGDPLFDLGVVLGYWVQKDDPELLKRSVATVTTMPGFMSRREFIQRYAEKSGRDCSNINFYLVFAYFKLAVIVQQIYYRWKQGQTQDERFRNYNKQARDLIEFSWYFAQHEKI